jgi:hypothetical protein
VLGVVRSRILIAFLCCVVSIAVLRFVSSGSVADDSHGGPNAHFQVSNPAELGSIRAEEIYQSIRKSMAEHYGESSDPLTETYNTGFAPTASRIRQPHMATSSSTIMSMRLLRRNSPRGTVLTLIRRAASS